MGRAGKPRYYSGIPELLVEAHCSLLAAPLSVLHLAPRAFRRLEQLGVVHIGDLRGFSDQDLLELEGFGLRSLRDLSNAIVVALGADYKPPKQLELVPSYPAPGQNVSGGSDILRFAPYESPEDLGATLRDFLSTQNGRTRDVLIKRMGMEGSVRTLEELGSEFLVTRERIRQIQKKALDRLYRETAIVRQVDSHLTSLLRDRTFPLYLAGLPAEDQWFAHVKNPELVLGFVFEYLADDKYHILELHGRRAVSRINEEEWARRKLSARAFVKGSVSQRLTSRDVFFAIQAIAGVDAAELSDELWGHAVTFAYFVKNGDGAEDVLVAYGRSVETLVTALLEESAEPLHYSEITRRAEVKFGAQEIRRVHNAAAAVGLLLGRGLYGLRRHIPVNRREEQYLVSLCEALVEEGPEGRQWHAGELLMELGQDAISQSLDAYSLTALLRQSSSLYYVRRLVWVKSTVGGGATKPRIDVRNAIEAILDDEGGPLTTWDLLKRISIFRGVSSTFQIHPKGRLIRVGPAKWGLIDRDVCVPRSDLVVCLDRLAAFLASDKRGVHVSELLGRAGCAELNADVAWQMLGAAQVDGRFRVFPGDFLCLSEWLSTNRVAVHEAIAAAVPLLKEGAEGEVIHRIMESALERAISYDTVRGALRNLGATYERVSGLWFLTPDQEMDDDDEIDQLVRRDS